MSLEKVYNDGRGSIYVDVRGDKELKVIHTRKGFARGGCIHYKEEKVICISGYIAFIVGDKKTYLEEGQSLIIPAKTPHYMVAFEDSVIVEEGSVKTTSEAKHKEMRIFVDLINEDYD